MSPVYDALQFSKDDNGKMKHCPNLLNRAQLKIPYNV